ncbi:hypothetical protein RIF29_18896 [Crotalaria pallida]|uniref:Uncharacterized protein n=1 Tax=Crotalaria pallida TaxID=3830 RepID=A0AAN9F0A1_CROPI
MEGLWFGSYKLRENIPRFVKESGVQKPVQAPAVKGFTKTKTKDVKGSHGVREGMKQASNQLGRVSWKKKNNIFKKHQDVGEGEWTGLSFKSQARMMEEPFVDFLSFSGGKNKTGDETVNDNSGFVSAVHKGVEEEDVSDSNDSFNQGLGIGGNSIKKVDWE